MAGTNRPSRVELSRIGAPGSRRAFGVNLGSIYPGDRLTSLLCGRRCSLRGRVEVHLGSLPRTLFRLEVCIVAGEARQAGYDVVGEQPNVGVVVLQGIVVPLTLDGDTVLGAGQLVLQAQEVFVGAQLRIVLDHHHQASQCGVELAVGGDLVLWSLGANHGSARGSDITEDLLFVKGKTLDRLEANHVQPLQEAVGVWLGSVTTLDQSDGRLGKGPVDGIWPDPIGLVEAYPSREVVAEGKQNGGPVFGVAAVTDPRSEILYRS